MLMLLQLSPSANFAASEVQGTKLPRSLSLVWYLKMVDIDTHKAAQKYIHSGSNLNIYIRGERATVQISEK